MTYSNVVSCLSKLVSYCYFLDEVLLLTGVVECCIAT